eukprot:scaffold98194_cov47-Attheya_sp.AAC.1
MELPFVCNRSGVQEILYRYLGWYVVECHEDSASNLDGADMKRCAWCVALCPLSKPSEIAKS